ncbi:hypothetical protein QA640_09110 [Bradyrhizobium sp. CB82]|uniref:hypothetical protein n=1 Tax=Bradyrhizobium sp. CB82 TaxID=3039159 RepID=UPI0024B21DBC|nr:hypothetical protein [Bradyrhizobium sp. CB82]WFU42598.1 hypothetical protein QA640_09110 [Bradyrhizobium sp. CB82]
MKMTRGEVRHWHLPRMLEIWGQSTEIGLATLMTATLILLVVDYAANQVQRALAAMGLDRDPRLASRPVADIRRLVPVHFDSRAMGNGIDRDQADVKSLGPQGNCVSPVETGASRREE